MFVMGDSFGQLQGNYLNALGQQASDYWNQVGQAQRARQIDDNNSLAVIQALTGERARQQNADMAQRQMAQQADWQRQQMALSGQQLDLSKQDMGLKRDEFNQRQEEMKRQRANMLFDHLAGGIEKGVLTDKDQVGAAARDLPDDLKGRLDDLFDARMQKRAQDDQQTAELTNARIWDTEAVKGKQAAQQAAMTALQNFEPSALRPNFDYAAGWLSPESNYAKRQEIVDRVNKATADVLSAAKQAAQGEMAKNPNYAGLVFDPRTGRVVARRPMPIPGGATATATGPGGMVPDGGAIDPNAGRQNVVPIPPLTATQSGDQAAMPQLAAALTNSPVLATNQVAAPAVQMRPIAAALAPTNGVVVAPPAAQPSGGAGPIYQAGKVKMRGPDGRAYWVDAGKVPAAARTPGWEILTQ